MVNPRESASSSMDSLSATLSISMLFWTPTIGSATSPDGASSAIGESSPLASSESPEAD